VSATLPISALLAWYDQNRRRLPWRALPGETPDPYRVWLSEIMLQQTTVATVIPYFEKFLLLFPTIQALASAPETEIMAAWAGLGYYARARNLHACARIVAQGGFPRDLRSLLALPGIGPYTAAAVAAIAFDVPIIPIDGNVERVLSRLFAITDPLPAAKPQIQAHAAQLADCRDARARPSDTAQALFDLGAAICTSGSPDCRRCPLTRYCKAYRDDIAADLPRKAPKPSRPSRFGAHFWLTDQRGNVLLRRRPPRGLLGGMTELPGTPWRAEGWDETQALALAPMLADWRKVGIVLHGFTHFELSIDVFAASVPQIFADGFLRPASALPGEALPSVMRKCVRLAEAAGCVISIEPA
jgi:A/G-specific adenine glycosylase